MVRPWFDGKARGPRGLLRPMQAWALRWGRRRTTWRLISHNGLLFRAGGRRTARCAPLLPDARAAILERVCLFGRHGDAPRLEIHGWGSIAAARAAGLDQPGLKMRVIRAERPSRKLNRTLASLNPGVDTTTVPLGSRWAVAGPGYTGRRRPDRSSYGGSRVAQ